MNNLPVGSEILQTPTNLFIRLPIQYVGVKLYNNSSNEDPVYANIGDAGMDVRANESKTIYPGTTEIVKTGLYVEIPPNYEIQVRPRSGLSAKTKMRISNSPGTIDSNYRGEIGIIIDNHGENEIIVSSGDKIAQLVLNQVPTINWIKVSSLDELTSTIRGAEGFGSTGV